MRNIRIEMMFTVVISIGANSVFAPSGSLLIVRCHVELVEFIFRKAPSGSVLPETSQASEWNGDECTCCGKNKEEMRTTVVYQKTRGECPKWSTSNISIDAPSPIDCAKHKEIRELPGSNEVTN